MTRTCHETRDPQAVVQRVWALACPKDPLHALFFAERRMFRKVLNRRAEVVEAGGKMESYTCADCGAPANITLDSYRPERR